MRTLQVLSAFLLCWSVSTSTSTAQPVPPVTSTNLFDLTINPEPYSLTNFAYFVSRSTNTITLQVNNRDIFTNIVITAAFGTNVGTNSIRFRDQGRPPDEAPDDGIFSANIIAPFVRLQVTNFTISFTVIGEDTTFVNPDPSITNAALVTNLFEATYLLIPRPENDNFTNAYKFEAAGGVAISTNNFASLEPGEPQHGKAPQVASSVWWTWSPNRDTPVLIDTAGSSFSPVLAIYTGQTLAELKLVASSTNDLRNNLQANVEFNALKGTTYRIAVAGYDDTTNSVGNVRLRVAPGGTADTRPPAVSITAPQTGILVDVEQLLISGTAREPFLTDSGISNIVLQVNNGPLTNAIGAENWFGTVTLPPGTNVIRAYAVDFAGNKSVPDSITVQYFSPTNDLFAYAVQLPGVSGIVNANNRRSTKEKGEPLHADNDGGRSVWYRWRAPSAGELTLSTVNSSFDTLLAVYAGSHVTNLQSVASNDDAFTGSGFSQISLTVDPGQLYFIAVDGFGGESGNLVLRHFFQPDDPGQFFTITVNNAPGGKVSPPSGVYPANAQVTLTAQPDPQYAFVNWEGSLTSTNNPLTLTVTGNLNFTPRFRVSQFTEDFETGDLRKLPWDTAINSGWHVQTNVTLAGKFSARSGPITDGRSSSLLLMTNTGPGMASFNLRVSSEPAWDFLHFYLNGQLVQRWSGETNQTFTFPIPAGNNRLEWRYVKDAHFSSGLDAAFLDNLYLPPDDKNAAVGTVSMLLFPEGAQVTIKGQPSRTYLLEASSDLRTWSPVGSKSSASGVVHFLDTRAGQFKVRFYRGVAE